MPKKIEDVLVHPLVRAFNPEGKHSLEARWLSKRLNPAARDGLEIAALIPFTIYPHIKAIPSFQMLLEDLEAGRYEGVHTLVVPSSGNTAHAVARLGPAFGLKVKVVLAADVPDSKKGILEALSSVYVISVPKGESTTRVALEESQRPGHYLLDQYGHAGNVRAHELYTGPDIIRACGDVDIIAVSMGSGGTVTGISNCLKRVNPKVIVIGVRPVRGQQVPGTRDKDKMAEVVTLPWEQAVDHVIEGSRKDSFIAMRELWSEVEPQPGPSSGLAFVGLKRWMDQLKPRRREELFAGKRAAFICPDDGRFYSERTTGELDPDQGLI